MNINFRFSPIYLYFKVEIHHPLNSNIEAILYVSNIKQYGIGAFRQLHTYIKMTYDIEISYVDILNAFLKQL